MSDELRNKLSAEVAVADGTLLLPHHRRGALLLLQPGLDLVELAVAVAEDDHTRIQTLVAESKLRAPTLAEMADFCVDPRVRFNFVIVQPFVLAQRLADTMPMKN